MRWDQGRDTINAMLRAGELQQVPASRDRADLLLGQADAHLVHAVDADRLERVVQRRQLANRRPDIVPASSIGQLSPVLGRNRVQSWPTAIRRPEKVLRMASSHQRWARESWKGDGASRSR